MASTAFSTVPYPVITITWVAGEISSAPRSTARPSSAAILMSVITMSNGSDNSRESAASPLSASNTSYPCCRSTSAVVVRMLRWSSTIRMWGRACRASGPEAGEPSPGMPSRIQSDCPVRESSCSGFEREAQAEFRPGPGLRQLDGPAVAFDDPAHHRQPQARSGGLGGEEGLEDLVDDLCRNPRPAVLDHDLRAGPPVCEGPRRAHIQPPRARHGLVGVEEEVHQRLAQ